MRMTAYRLFFSRAYFGWRLIGLWLLGAFSVVLSLVMPQQVGRLTNLFTGGSPASWSVVRKSVLIMVVAQMAISILSYVRRRAQVTQLELITRTLTLTLFARVMRFSADFFRNSEVAKINSRILDDSSMVSNFLVEAAVNAPLAILSLFIFGGVMIAHNPLLGACMVPISALSGYYLFFDRQIQAVNRGARRSFDEIRTDASEMVSAVAEFRCHNAFDFGRNNLNRRLLQYQSVMMEIGKLTAMFQAASPLVVSIQTGVLYFIGAALCMRGTMRWGDVIAFLLLAQLFQKPVSDVAAFGLSWRMSRESMRRIEELLQRPTAFDALPNAPQVPASPEILYDQASVNAESGGLILNAFTQQIGAGEHVAFCGPAGCGKTTAVQMLVRNTAPSSGNVVISGKSIETYDLDSLARRIGFVPQKPVILNTSLRNNLLLGLRRQVEGGMSDAEGPLDMAVLPPAASADDLNTRLIEVVREVGLETDIFNKCMDLPAKTVRAGNPRTDRLAELRPLIAARLKMDDRDVIPLAVDRYFPGTIGENLFGPGYRASTSVEEAARVLVLCAGDMPVFADMLKLGLARLRHERALAVSVLNRSPGLIRVLDLRPRELGRELTEELDSSDLARLQALPPRLQTMLVEVVLEDTAPGEFGRPPADSFAARILQARTALLDAEETVRRRWRAIESDPLLPDLTIRENLLRARCNPHRRDALERADACIWAVLSDQHRTADALLLGLEYRAGEDGSFLSGGQKQKVAIARVLMKDPRILLLDEATSAMDEVSQQRIVELVGSRFAGKTVLSISHRLSTIRDFHRVLLLDRGRLIESGPFDQLAVAGGMFPQLLRQEKGLPAAAMPESELATDPVAAEAGESSSEIARKLSLCPLFAELASDRLSFLSRATTVFNFRPGELLFRRGDPGEEIFVILEGEIEFFMPRPGQEDQIFSRYQAGRAFGELAVFGQGVRSLSARSVKASRIASLSREKLLPIMAAEPQIALALLKALSQLIIASEARAAQATAPETA